MIEQEQAAEAQLQEGIWYPVFERSDYNWPVTYGVSFKVEGGQRYYQAWAQVGEPANERLESAVYEACDAADPQFEMDTVRSWSISYREHVIAQAAQVRGRMREDQASPADMERMAMALHDKGNQRLHEVREQEEARLKRLAEDEIALKQARLWLRGMQLLIDGGTDEELKVLRYLFSSGKERRF